MSGARPLHGAQFCFSPGRRTMPSACKFRLELQVVAFSTVSPAAISPHSAGAKAVGKLPATPVSGF
jgi:hypothetical protein